MYMTKITIQVFLCHHGYEITPESSQYHGYWEKIWNLCQIIISVYFVISGQKYNIFVGNLLKIAPHLFLKWPWIPFIRKLRISLHEIRISYSDWKYSIHFGPFQPWFICIYSQFTRNLLGPVDSLESSSRFWYSWTQWKCRDIVWGLIYLSFREICHKQQVPNQNQYCVK